MKKKKKNGAFGAGQFSLGTLAGGRPGTTIFQNPEGGGGGGGGGAGGVAYKDRARPPPPWHTAPIIPVIIQVTAPKTTLPADSCTINSKL